MSEQDKRVLKGEQTRQAIIEAAIRVISLEGINEVSAAKIASSIGISKSNVFHHFKTREQILIGVHDMICEQLFLALKERKAPTLEGYLLSIGSDLFKVTTEASEPYKVFFSFYNQGLFQDNLKSILIQSLEKLVQLIEEKIKEHMDVDKLKEERIAEVSRMMLAFMDGIGLHHLLNPNPQAYLRLWEIQVFWMIDYLKGK